MAKRHDILMPEGNSGRIQANNVLMLLTAGGDEYRRMKASDYIII